MKKHNLVFSMLIVAVSLLLTGCADQGENLALSIKPDGTSDFKEVDLLHLIYIPIVEDPVDGLIVRTCPEDLEDDTIVSHSFYAPSEREKERGLTYIVNINQAMDPGARSLLKDNNIYIPPDMDAVFVYLEAWHVDDVARSPSHCS